MIGKKVKVFWPVDERWYEGVVEEFNQSMGEHKLRYKDGDIEWVKIGEFAGPGSSEAKESSASAETKNDKRSPPSSSVNAQPAPAGGAATQSPPMQGPVGTGNTPTGTVRGQQAPANPDNSQQQRMVYNQGMNRGPYPPPVYGAQPQPYGAPAGNPGNYPMPYPQQPGHYAPHMPPQMPFGYPPATMPHTHVPNPSPTNRVSPEKDQKRPSPNSKSGSPQKKNPPKTWSKEEDSQLLNLVQRMQIPVKWSYVAQNMEGRSGKQCRERYVNHLNPRLKSCDWSPIEDATIFSLYNTTGSQWAKMSKMIPGRTDNGIKNRFHNLRRQLEREDEQRMRLSKSEDFPEEVRIDRIRKFPEHLRGKADKCWDVFESLGVLAAQSVLGGSLSRNASRFGPFRKAADTGEQCARCGLYAPSTHCGTEICTKSKWCIACTRVPPHLCSNLLRECIRLRRVAGNEDRTERKNTPLVATD
jgi:hypothetical protein